MTIYGTGLSTTEYLLYHAVTSEVVSPFLKSGHYLTT